LLRSRPHRSGGQQILGAIGNQEAQSVIEREKIIRLSRRDCERLLDLLENPPKPNARFKAAMNYYGQTKIADADSSFDWRP
jgi:uncharacterized protein (DUF1778 family)